MGWLFVERIMAKHKFRKMYFICEDKKVIETDVHMTQAYQYKKHADQVCKERSQRAEHYLWEDKTKPLPKHTVEGFYLVPEALYDEILKKYVE